MRNVETPNTTSVDTLPLPKYQFSPNQFLNLRITISVKSNPTVSSYFEQQLYFKVTPLVLHIIGGNRVQSYSKETVMISQAKDLDVAESQQELGIDYSWTCEDMLKAPCKNIYGDPIELNSTNTLTYIPKFFTPYFGFIFNATASKTSNGKSATVSAVIIIYEQDIPKLSVNIPRRIISQPVNKNDDIQVDIDYDGNPDSVFFSFAIYYNFDIVETRVIKYYKFAFRIEDININFNGVENRVMLRISMSDPRYMMPSQNSYTLIINDSPLVGRFLVTPSTGGLSCSTTFSLVANGFYDVDAPLSYKFYFYVDVNLILLEF